MHKSGYTGTVDGKLEISILNLYLSELRSQHLGLCGSLKVLKVYTELIEEEPRNKGIELVERNSLLFPFCYTLFTNTRQSFIST